VDLQFHAGVWCLKIFGLLLDVEWGPCL